MKKTILMVLCIALGACTNKEPTIEHCALLIDKTDSNSLAEQIDSMVLSQITTPQQIFDGCDFCLKFINDKRHNPFYTLSLSPVTDPLEFNEFERKREVYLFQSKLGTFSDKIKENSIGASNSLVFFSIHKEIQKVIDGKYKTSNIYVVSDLQNKDEVFNSYHKDDFGLLKYDTDSLSKLLDIHFPIAKIGVQEITIHLLYQPKNKEDDFAFDRTADFLSHYYTKKGIKVKIDSRFSISQAL